MLLLDTHVMHWLALGDSRLGQRSRDRIEAVAASDICISAVSLWEIGTLIRNSRLRPPLAFDLKSLRSTYLLHGFRMLDLSVEGVMRADELPDFHQDPGDRFLVATAMVLNLELVTADRKILAWSGPVMRMNASQ